MREASANGKIRSSAEARTFKDTCYTWLSVAIQRATAIFALDGLMNCRAALADAAARH
jgi:hypothetical protein